MSSQYYSRLGLVGAEEAEAREEDEEDGEEDLLGSAAWLPLELDASLRTTEHRQCKRSELHRSCNF